MIKSAVLAAVAIVGTGTAAGAATVTTVSYDFLLRYEGTRYEGLEYYDLVDEVGRDAYNVEIGEAPSWLKPQVFSELSIGDIIQFKALVNYLSPPEWDIDYSNGGTAPICQIGPVSCIRTNYTSIGEYGLNPNEFALNQSDSISITSNGRIGGFLEYSYWTLPYTFNTDDRRYFYVTRFQDALFTIIQPAPVPLPASAALLPFGFGALAMMRKRRKRVS